jgi:hypothetical protein
LPKRCYEIIKYINVNEEAFSNWPEIECKWPQNK